MKQFRAKVLKLVKVEVLKNLLENVQKDILACYVEAVSPIGTKVIGKIAKNAKICTI